ncbi:MAG: substrate-binding domain-containing protein [Cyclobacteriaceae bacterium]|nr:substrate-binding domain-containing protein [Cyclobacteriaceae bacterium]
MGKNTNYTINDIAKMANVSRGTVDRVIHGRGTVSKRAYEKVKIVLDKIDYKPNLIAQSLKKGELSKIAALIPDHQYDVFWKRPLDGIEKVKQDYASLGVTIENFLFNPYNPQSFRENAIKILEKQFEGILVVPFFYKESLDFFKKCDEQSIPYITFNTFLEDANAVSHVGQDLKQSGRVAAELMNKIAHTNGKLLIIHIDEDLADSIHMQKKEMGFSHYNGQNPQNFELQVLRTSPSENIETILVDLLQFDPEIKGIYVTTSKVFLVANILQKYQIKKYLIGYDLIEENLSFLKSGIIDFLIFQNPEYQANLGISYLIDLLVFKKEIPKKKLLPIEIAMKENYKNYIQ